MNETAMDMSPYKDFESASHAVLQFLHERLGFGLWVLTRTEGSDWIVLQAEDHKYGIEEGAVFRWEDSFCYHMARGDGPNVAPDTSQVPVYAQAPIGRQVEIGSYIGVPVHEEDGSLFGTLCAIDPSPQQESLRAELPLVEVMAKLLGTVLSRERKSIKQERALERSQQEAMTDVMTGLCNRRGWNIVVAAEEDRARRYGNPTGVIVVDLDGLKKVNDARGHAKGDELIGITGQALREGVRESDVVARIGGDEFAILAVECDRASLESLHERVQASLAAYGITASTGIATRSPELGLSHAISEADRQMYANKSTRGRKR